MSGTRQRGASVTIPIRTEGAQAAERDLRRLGQSGDRALRQITLSAGLAQRAMGLIGPVLAGLSAGALVAFARNAISAAGAIGEVAEQIGVTTDALQVLQFGAVQSGISMEELERGLAILTRTIADAETGSGDAAARFERFGIAFRDANGNVRATEAILGDVSDAMSRLESPTERAALATAIFGDRLGQRLIPLLLGGRQALTEYERQARATGQVLDDDMARAARRANDQIAALGRTFEVFARNLILTVVPPINEVTTAIGRLIYGMSAAERSAQIGRDVLRLGREIAALEAGGTDPSLLGAFQTPGEIAASGAGRISALRAQQAALIAESRRLAEAFSAPPATFADRPTVAPGLPFPPPPVPEVPGAPGARGGGGAQGLDVQAIQQRLINEVLRDREQIIRSNISPAEQYADRMERLGRVVETLANTPDALTPLQIEREQIAALEEYERALGRVASSLDRFASESSDVFGGIADASVRAMKGIEDAIVTAAQTGRLEWRGLVNSILADLARLVIRQTITGPLGSALSSALGGLSGARAMGGPVFPGRAYRVGEFGPETFVPSSTGRVVPGGGGVTVNLTIGVGVAQTVAAEIRNLLPSITQAVEAGVADRAQRGGGYAAAVRGR
jgi:TP901 family phage tail tape measure protein